MIQTEDTYFSRREFSFTLPGDIYIRYQSFRDDEELTKALTQKNPIKIDIGAVFSHNPREVKKGNVLAKAEYRELIFDIDMTDYDEVRTCCQGADLCKKCWPFLSLAAQILHESLTTHFGFKHLLWVYSGRRGIHCWVCDQDARKLSADARSAIADYLTVVVGGQHMSKKVSLDPKNNALHHPLIDVALKKIDMVFESLILKDQDYFAGRKRREEVISWASPRSLQDKVRGNLPTDKKTSKQFWDALQSIAHGYDALGNSRFKYGEVYLAEVKLQLCYPRLDINVSKGINHLLKAPFCIHPKTGRVCVPFDIESVTSFDPTSVPIIKDLVRQVEEGKGGDARQTTTIKKSIAIFDKFLRDLCTERTKKDLESKDQMEF